MQFTTGGISSTFWERLLFISAILLGIITISNIGIQLYLWNSWAQLLWYCDIAAMLLSVGILLRDKYLCTAVLITAIPAQSPWIVDFIRELLGHGAGRTAFIFDNLYYGDLFILSIILHSVVIPLAALAVWRYGFDEDAWRLSFFVFVLVLMPLTVVLTKSSLNVNCVFYPCDLRYKEHYDIIMQNAQYGTWKYFTKYLLFATTLVTATHLTLSMLFRKDPRHTREAHAT